MKTPTIVVVGTVLLAALGVLGMAMGSCAAGGSLVGQGSIELLRSQPGVNPAQLEQQIALVEAQAAYVPFQVLAGVLNILASVGLVAAAFFLGTMRTRARQLVPAATALALLADFVSLGVALVVQVASQSAVTNMANTPGGMGEIMAASMWLGACFGVLMLLVKIASYAVAVIAVRKPDVVANLK